MQLNDSDIAQVIDWLESNTRPTVADTGSASKTLLGLCRHYDSLTMCDGVLHRMFWNSNGRVSHYQIVSPSEMKAHFLESVHNDKLGHFKFAESAMLLAKEVWWPTWQTDLRMYIRRCAGCGNAAVTH